MLSYTSDLIKTIIVVPFTLNGDCDDDVDRARRSEKSERENIFNYFLPTTIFHFLFLLLHPGNNANVS
jgi:hypothetical protein